MPLSASGEPLNRICYIAFDLGCSAPRLEQVPPAVIGLNIGVIHANGPHSLCDMLARLLVLRIDCIAGASAQRIVKQRAVTDLCKGGEKTLFY